MGYETMAVCDACWASLNGRVAPVRAVVEKRSWAACWRCTVTHKSGIYMRAFVTAEGTVQLPNG